MCRIFLLVWIVSVQGLNSIVLESKLVDAVELGIQPIVYLASIRHEEDKKWIHFCTAYYISTNFFLTLRLCINKIEAKIEPNPQKVRIFLKTQKMKGHSKPYKIIHMDAFDDYQMRRKRYCLELTSIPKIDVGLIRGEPYAFGTIKVMDLYIFSNLYISPPTRTKIIGWSHGISKDSELIISQKAVDISDFAKCSKFFENENFNEYHMCGFSVNDTQLTDSNDYGSPLFSKDNKIIGILSHISELTRTVVGFIRVHDLANRLEQWKGRLRESVAKKNRRIK